MKIPLLTASHSLTLTAQSTDFTSPGGLLVPMSHKKGKKFVRIQVTYREGNVDGSGSYVIELEKLRLHHPAEYQNESEICADACHDVKADLQAEGKTRVKCVGCNVFTQKG